MHTSVPSFDSDVKCAQALKAANPALKIGMIGAKVAVKSDESLSDAPVIDFVARNEFDFTIKEVADGLALVLDPGPLLPQRGGERSSITRIARSWRRWTAYRA